MSNPGTPTKSSIGLTGQQGGSSQAGSSGASGSGAGASGSNAQQSSIALVNSGGSQAPAAAGGAAAMVDLNRSIRTPKPYYPKKDGDFKAWVRHLEHYFTLLNVGDGRKTTVLLYYLGDEASNTAFHLNITDATNYDDAKNALMQYFSPVETPEEIRTKFHQRYQGSDETLEHFAMELRVLSSKAYPTMGPDELEEMSKQQFILGVRNNAIRERLIVQRPAKLKDAIEYGRLLEVANRTTRGTTNQNTRGVFTSFPASNNTRFNNQSNNRANNYFGQQQNSNYRGPPRNVWPPSNSSYTSGYMAPNGPAPRKPLTCYTCGKLGHKAIDCRSKPPNAPQSGNFVKGQWPNTRFNNTSKDKPKLPQNNMIVESDEDEPDQHDNGMVLVGNEDTCQAAILAVQGMIAGKEVEDLIVDTGSAISLISTQFYDTLGGNLQLQPIKGRYMVANGSLLSIKGSIDLTIAFDKIEITQKFLCVDSQLTLALLGYDFIRKNKVDILTSASCLLIQNVPIITHMHKSRKSVGVILTANTTVAPQSENILECQAEEDEAHLIEQDCCLIEPNQTLEEKLGVLIARGLVTPKRTMPIRLMNVNNRNVIL